MGGPGLGPACTPQCIPAPQPRHNQHCSGSPGPASAAAAHLLRCDGSTAATAAEAPRRRAVPAPRVNRRAARPDRDAADAPRGGRARTVLRDMICAVADCRPAPHPGPASVGRPGRPWITGTQTGALTDAPARLAARLESWTISCALRRSPSGPLKPGRFAALSEGRCYLRGLAPLRRGAAADSRARRRDPVSRGPALPHPGRFGPGPHPGTCAAAARDMEPSRVPGPSSPTATRPCRRLSHCCQMWRRAPLPAAAWAAEDDQLVLTPCPALACRQRLSARLRAGTAAQQPGPCAPLAVKTRATRLPVHARLLAGDMLPVFLSRRSSP